MSKLERQQARLTDLRDDKDKLKGVDPKDDAVQESYDNLVEFVNRQIDRTKVRIKKLKKENRQRKGAKPHVVLTRISPNKSARLTPIEGIVIHCTVSNNIEGSDSDLAGVANWFANPGADVSAHVIVDSDGHSAVCVESKDKAWHCACYNSPALGIENIGQVYTDWNEKELDEAARWVAKWCKQYNIPCQRGAVSGCRFTKKGIVTHAELGSLGGNHSDPGTKYDIDLLIKKAKTYM